MNKKLKLSKVTYPDKRISYDEWKNQFGVGCLYNPPPKLFEGNHFNTEVYSRKKGSRIFSGILKFLNKLS